MQLDQLVLSQSNGGIEDFLRLQTIHAVAMKDTVINSLGEWNKKVQINRLKKNFDKHWKSLYFLNYKTSVIGTINLRKEEGHIYIEQLYLLPEYQGKGIGSYLMKKYCENIEVRLSVLKNDIGANTFYEKNGFTLIAQDQYQNHLKRSM